MDGTIDLRCSLRSFAFNSLLYSDSVIPLLYFMYEAKIVNKKKSPTSVPIMATFAAAFGLLRFENDDEYADEEEDEDDGCC